MQIDENILSKENRKKLEELNNPKVLEIVDKYVNLCKPKKVTVITDKKEDLEYVRELSIENKEETKLSMEGHTIHFDGYNDQGRDAKNTKVLLPKGKKLSKLTLTVDKDEGTKEILGLLDGIMKDREMLICFFCLGPNNSKFSIAALQLTDSAYVAHSESILYRPGYEEFKRLNGKEDFFHFIHSSGEVDEKNNSKNVDKRRIYMDLEDERVFTINNQYAGNSVGLKKLSLRLAISKANREDWLSEHMFIMGAKSLDHDRTTYFTGAFPSACGKTSTAMIPGQTIVGDDIAYLRVGDDGKCYAANVEQGIFGIIQDVNPIDDPLIYKVLTTPRELIFSNILEKEGKTYWLGMGSQIPNEGFNFSGNWTKGKLGPDGKEILPAHKNARYTIRIEDLDNANKNLHNPNGVPIDGVIYGGRDSDTNVPVAESLSWSHGVFIGACIESETTAAKIGEEGKVTHDPMANQDFLVVPLGTYLKNHLAFGDRLDKIPKIFATNYFLKKDGKFVNDKVDKKVWLMWMEKRVNEECKAIETPIGHIPLYEDLNLLFKKIFNKEYTKEEYNFQFSIRVNKLVERLERIKKIYSEEENLPEIFLDHIRHQEGSLCLAKKKYGKDVILPEEFK
jgi:phosphoenolpyruvate carboxykinase (GTP)